MNELEANQQIADRICRDFVYDGQKFTRGDCVAILDGEVVAVETSFDKALTRLRSIDPDPNRGMLLEVKPLVVEVIR